MPFYWNPNPVAFTIPFLNLPIFIYGICFVTGLLLGYALLNTLLKQDLRQLSQEEMKKMLDRLVWFSIGGILIGARLGHVFFYEWDRYKNNLWLIFNTREGGLASHGGTIGVVIGLTLFYFLYFKKKTGLLFLELLDRITIPAALVAFFIRLGNFFNQEILGTPTDGPFAVIFGNPQDGSAPVPRHPAQLYEGFFYLFTSIFLLILWYKTDLKKKPGFFTGLLFTLIFGFRFFIEELKEHQHAMLDQSWLQAGQTLSIPFVIIGISLIIYAFLNKKLNNKTSLL